MGGYGVHILQNDEGRGGISTAIGDNDGGCKSDPELRPRDNAIVAMRGFHVFNLPSASIKSFLLSKTYKLFQAPSHSSQALPLIKITLHLVQR